ncbi:MAG: response regulator, partial [Spirochaetota bacterium]
MIEKSQKIILLVEDEAVTARLTREILERNGYRVILSQTGEEAVDLIKKNEPVDLILMDIDMGEGIDGTSAASQMLRNRDIPLVFLSAHSDPEFVKKTKEITSYGYVLKNSGEAVLLASIKMALKLYETKEDLKEAEERYRNLFVNSQVGIFIIRLNEGTILEANDCFAHILGFKNRKELLNEPVSIMDFYVDKKIRHQMELILKTNGEINNFEVQFKCRNG